jgi:P-type Ca2+ transporter type 2C
VAAHVRDGERRDSRRFVVISNAVPGRARMHVPILRRQPALALQLQERLGRDDGIHHIGASPITGNVLVLFDPRRLGLGEVQRRLEHETATYRPLSGRPRNGYDSRKPSAPEGPAWHTREATDVMRALNENPAGGLSGQEAEARLAVSGPNRLPAPQPKSTLEVLWRQVASLPVALLAGAAAASVATGGLIDGIAILAVIAINSGIGYATESRVERILAALNEVGIPMAFVRRDSVEQLLPRADLVPGDVMLLRPGHDVPADGRLITVSGLQANESALTGEAVPVLKSTEPVARPNAPIADRHDMVYAGTVVAEGTGEAIVTATGRQTELGRIRALVSEAEAPRTPLERQLDDTGRQLALASLGLSGALFVIGVLRGLPPLVTFRTAASLAVAAVPEGLPTVATTTLALGMRRMFERRMLVRRLNSVESLGATTVICVDKTGTVTENRMTVGRWYVADRDRLQDDAAPGPLDPAMMRALTIAVLCNEATLKVDGDGGLQTTGSATEASLLIAARAWGIDAAVLRERHPLQATSPRSDGRNWMGSMHAQAGGRVVAVKGAPEEVLRSCGSYVCPDGDAALDVVARRRILSANDRMAGEGMRVLGLAWRTLDAKAEPSWVGLTWIGLVGLIDPLRPGVREAIAICHHAGIRPLMITGDQGLTAVAVGRKLGLHREGPMRVLEAGELARLDATALRGVVREVDVFARVAPAQKYEIVRALQASGDVVAMTGDGVNDGPALKAADIGVAMGERGTEMARDLADVVLMDDDFGSIVAAVENGRTLRANLQKALRFLLATNLAEVLVTFGATILGRAQPLSALHLLWINLISDVVPALALGMEPAEPGVMRRPPPVPGASLLSRDDFATTALDASIMAAATLGAFGITLRRSSDAARASTVAFSTISTGQLLYALACRSGERSGLRGLAENPVLMAGIGGMLALQGATVLVPPLRALLATTPLGVADLAVVSAGAVVPLVVREALKTRRPHESNPGGRGA